MIKPAEVAIVCHGDEEYGVGTAVKLYAEYMPEAFFLALREGTLTQFLRHSGRRVEVIGIPRSTVAGGAPLTLAKLPGTLRQSRKTALRILPILRHQGIRVFHSQWLGQQIIGGYLRDHGILNIWHIQNNMNIKRLLGLGVKMNHMLARRYADAIMAVSGFIARNWEGCGRPVATVWNAAKPIYDHVIKAPEGPFRCVIAGRVETSKGHHLAVEAVIAARASGLDVRLDIFGSSTEGTAYAQGLQERIASTGNQEAIKFRGFVGNLRELHPMYHLGLQCRIDPEPCSLWVCEALADGLPLLASASGGTPELVVEGQTGRLYAPGNQGEITRKLQELLRDPEALHAMRLAAFKRGQVELHPARMVKQTMEAYELAARG